ncbi:MAG: tetratricopeptide repeat protein [Planctomycetota bacterium]
MDTLCFVFATAGSIACYLFTALLALGREEAGYGQRLWAQRWFMVLVAILTLAVLGPGIGWLAWLMPGRFGVVGTVVVGVALFVGPARLIFLILVERAASGFVDGLLAPGARRLHVPADCAHARAAEARGDLDAAERLYHEALVGNPKHDDTVHLALGNLLRKQGRDRDAADAWERALLGDLPPDQHLVTALRLGDLLRDRLHSPQRARRILEAALDRYPDAPEAEALRRRLAAPASAGGSRSTPPV